MSTQQVSTVASKSALGSLFRVLTERQDTDTQIYTRDILVGLKDLGVLAQQIDTQLGLYQKISYTTNAVVTFSDNRSKQFHSIAELPKFNWDRPVETTSVSLKWNILIEAQDGEKPTEHNILVRLATGIKPQDLMRAMFSKDLDEMESFEMASAGCACHVTFATQSLAGDIFRVVEEWVQGRPTAQYSAPYLKTLRRRSDLIFKLVRHSLPVSAVFALLAYFCHTTHQLDQGATASIGFIRQTMLFGVLLWVTFLVSGFISRWLAGHLHGLLHKIGMLHPFTLSAGDDNRQTALAAKNKKNFTRLCFEGSLAVAWNIVAAVIIVLFTWLHNPKGEQGGADQPATRSESISKGDQKPQTESELRPR